MVGRTLNHYEVFQPPRDVCSPAPVTDGAPSL